MRGIGEALLHRLNHLAEILAIHTFEVGTE
jgi:hypothetical protein